MIPIALIVIVWLIAVAIFLIFAGLSIMQMLKFGVKNPVTKWSIIIFIGAALIIVLGTLLFLSQINLQTGLDLRPIYESVFVI
jgi:uncharacterized membrane protein SirB2